MNNPLIIPILEYLRAQNSSCSIVDLVNLCEQDLHSLIGKETDPQIAIFQKNFFVMNALYQIQGDIQSEGFILSIFPLEISLVPHRSDNQNSLTQRDSKLAQYYLDWSNLTTITLDKVERLFASFWQRYSAIDKVTLALTTLGLEQSATWPEIRQAYQKQIVVSHPDKGGCAEDFIKTREAYEILSLNYRS